MAESDEQPADEAASEIEPVVSPPAVETDDDTPHPSEGLQTRGEVTGTETVAADAVPAGYPAEIATAQALAVEVNLGGPDDITVRLYFESPETGVGDRLGRLLADSEPSDSVGQSLLVTVDGGYYMPVVPTEPPLGSNRAVYGIGLGLAPSLLVGIVGIFAPGAGILASTPFVIAWFVGTFLVLPASVYLDALYLQSTTNWAGTPRTWTILSVIPPINVLVVPLYLIGRENAQSL